LAVQDTAATLLFSEHENDSKAGRRHRGLFRGHPDVDPRPDRGDRL